MRSAALTFLFLFSCAVSINRMSDRGLRIADNGWKNVKREMLNKRKIQREPDVLRWEKRISARSSDAISLRERA